MRVRRTQRKTRHQPSNYYCAIVPALVHRHILCIISASEGNSKMTCQWINFGKFEHEFYQFFLTR